MRVSDSSTVAAIPRDVRLRYFIPAGCVGPRGLCGVGPSLLDRFGLLYARPLVAIFGVLTVLVLVKRVLFLFLFIIQADECADRYS